MLNESTNQKGRFENELQDWDTQQSTSESEHDYTQDRQSFEGLNAHTKSHCQLLLDYAKDNLCQATYEIIDDNFTIVWDETLTFRQKDRQQARASLDHALHFINKETLHTFLTKEALSRTESEMYYEYGVATPEGIYNEH